MVVIVRLALERARWLGSCARYSGSVPQPPVKVQALAGRASVRVAAVASAVSAAARASPCAAAADSSEVVWQPKPHAWHASQQHSPYSLRKRGRRQPRRVRRCARQKGASMHWPGPKSRDGPAVCGAPAARCRLASADGAVKQRALREAGTKSQLLSRAHRPSPKPCELCGFSLFLSPAESPRAVSRAPGKNCTLCTRPRSSHPFRRRTSRSSTLCRPPSRPGPAPRLCRRSSPRKVPAAVAGQVVPAACPYRKDWNSRWPETTARARCPCSRGPAGGFASSASSRAPRPA